jgi:hypothetical protein
MSVASLRQRRGRSIEFEPKWKSILHQGSLKTALTFVPVMTSDIASSQKRCKRAGWLGSRAGSQDQQRAEPRRIAGTDHNSFRANRVRAQTRRKTRVAQRNAFGNPIALNRTCVQLPRPI